MTAMNFIFLPGVMSSQEKDFLLPTTSAKKVVVHLAYQYYNMACLLTHQQLETHLCIVGAMVVMLKHQIISICSTEQIFILLD